MIDLLKITILTGLLVFWCSLNESSAIEMLLEYNVTYKTMPNSDSVKRSIQQHMDLKGVKNDAFLNHLHNRYNSGDSIKFPFKILVVVEGDKLISFQMDDYYPPVNNAVVFHKTDFPKKKKIRCDGKYITEYINHSFKNENEEPTKKKCDYNPIGLNICDDFFLQVFLESQCMFHQAQIENGRKKVNSKFSINQIGDKLNIFVISSNEKFIREAVFCKSHGRTYILEHFVRSFGKDTKKIENVVDFKLEKVTIVKEEINDES